MPDPIRQPNFRLRRPKQWRGGLILASPHSGRDYPDWFLAHSALDPLELRTSEDAFVDRLIAPARALGAVVLSARVPRCVVDLNRARDDLDPAAIEGVKGAPSARSRAGLGVIPRVVARGRPIRARPLTRDEAEARLATLWQPYHDALDALMAEAVARFGQAVLIDVHSMPHDAVARLVHPPQVVLGDLWGASAGGWLRHAVAGAVTDEGLRLSRNVPFAGAHILARHGRPLARRHAVQLEIDRSLYMDEAKVRPNGGFPALSATLGRLWLKIAELCDERAAARNDARSLVRVEHPVWRP